MRLKLFLKQYSFDILVLLIGLTLGTFLMFSSFESKDNLLMISGKSWSDFASHIPLIRSFSLGANIPPEFPLFPGEHIKYHFLFYFLVGNLEKIGLPISYALNIPSILGFTALIYMVYIFAKQIFKSKTVGLISVIFFIFNSSLSFIYFFNSYPLSSNTILEIFRNADFLSFAPYGDGIITAFWNLNIYTNQRHLSLAFAFSLFILYLVIRPIFSKKKLNFKQSILLGILLGISFYFHLAALLMTSLVLSALLIVFPKIRKPIFLLLATAVIISIPQYLYQSSGSGFKPEIVIGYLTANNLTIYKFIEFWIYNLGISILLILIGFYYSDKNQKKLFAAFFIIFIIGNMVQFSIEMAANHKFFNYFILFANMYSAFALVNLWRAKSYLKPIVVTFFFLMILGGILDFFPLYNDRKISIPDYKSNLSSLWIMENTPRDALFLNTGYLYDPASLAGRKIFLGWPYFAWSQGYDTNQRSEVMKNILGAQDKKSACKLLVENNIDFIEIKIQNPPDPNIPPISQVFEKEFTKKYNLEYEKYTIYDVETNCNNL